MKVYVVIGDEGTVIGVARDVDGAKLIADTMRDSSWKWPHVWEQLYNGCLRRISTSLDYQDIEEWDLV